jgi:hypothetical protein
MGLSSISSAVPERLAPANRAGGARLLSFSNQTFIRTTHFNF